MKHTISVLVENHFGVLARVAGLFSARGFNIDSLAVGETQDPEVSRMTVIAQGDDHVVDQIMKQLGKLVDVICVENVTDKDVIERELVLIKLGANASNRNDIMHVVNTFRAKIVDVSPDSMTIEVTGSEGKIDAILELLRPFNLREVVRTGQIAMARRHEMKLPRKKGAGNKKRAKKKKS
ncbi:MAG: putative acetolactate synthase small subunit [Candidatus Omnitrophica bacterium ADurb.Bin277]|nr:MAG: putative acetolactate synthase small subunit [Candidatus Omnitrophica bacterium ADurb.Bin277]